MAKTKAKQDQAPDRRPITDLQAERLSALTDLSVKDLAGLSVAELSEKFKFRIDPALLCLRRICGRVVKKDPAHGVEYPVPFATVHRHSRHRHLWPILCLRAVLGSGLDFAVAPRAYLFPRHLHQAKDPGHIGRAAAGTPDHPPAATTAGPTSFPAKRGRHGATAGRGVGRA